MFDLISCHTHRLQVREHGYSGGIRSAQDPESYQEILMQSVSSKTCSTLMKLHARASLGLIGCYISRNPGGGVWS